LTTTVVVVIITTTMVMAMVSQVRNKLRLRTALLPLCF
jgi:hypothetical protein